MIDVYSFHSRYLAISGANRTLALVPGDRKFRVLEPWPRRKSKNESILISPE